MASVYSIRTEFGPLDKDGHGKNGGGIFLVAGATRTVCVAAIEAFYADRDNPPSLHVTRFMGDAPQGAALDAGKLLRRLERIKKGKDTRLGILVDSDVRAAGPVQKGNAILRLPTGPQKGGA